MIYYLLYFSLLLRTYDIILDKYSLTPCQLNRGNLQKQKKGEKFHTRGYPYSSPFWPECFTGGGVGLSILNQCCCEVRCIHSQVWVDFGSY